MTPTRRDALIAGLAVAVALPARAQGPDAFAYSGRLEQGGFLLGRTRGGAAVRVDDQVVGTAAADGLFVVGFDRDAPAAVRVAVDRGAGFESRSLAVAPVVYDVQRIDGLPPDQVTPTDPRLLERIKRELALKIAALASVVPNTDFAGGFVAPIAHAVRTSRFGPQRILNGVAKPPHYGVDLAAPAGTPIRAPAPGLVVLVQPDMHFEGGLTLIDHGQGLVAAFLHQSAQHVQVAQRVVTGQVIGEVGMKGRATGPHLCWRLTWRGRHMDPSLWVDAPPPPTA